MFDERERVNRRLAGRIAADQIVPYPPGIPVLVPGQLITKKIVDYLGGLLHSHKRMEMHGVVHEGYLPCIRVLQARGSARAGARRLGHRLVHAAPLRGGAVQGMERADAVADARVKRGEQAPRRATCRRRASTA